MIPMRMWIAMIASRIRLHAEMKFIPFAWSDGGREGRVVGRLLHAVAEDDRVADSDEEPETADQETRHAESHQHDGSALVPV